MQIIKQIVTEKNNVLLDSSDPINLVIEKLDNIEEILKKIEQLLKVYL